MANELRLIDANAVELKIRQIIAEVQEMRYRKSNNKCAVNYIDEIYKLDNWLGSYAEILDLVENATTVDAVEVVRCKDCKHYDNSEGICWCHLNSKFYPGGSDWHSFPEDGFCSYGERKDNE